MPKDKRYYPDYIKLCPELADRPDILNFLRITDRQLKYAELDRKQERFVYNAEEQIAVFLPSYEDSLERMQEEEHRQFSDEADLEAQVILREYIHRALIQLEEQEQELIRALYYQGLSERQYAQITGIPQRTINDRRRRILRKLKILLKK